MEKFLAILLALCMVFSLAACSGGGTGNSPPASNTRNGGRQTQQPSGGGDDPGAAAAKEITLWTYPIGNWGQKAVVNELTAHCMAINVNAFEAAGALQYADLDSHTWTTENFFKAVQALYNKYGETVGALFCSGQGGDPEKTMTGDKIAFMSFPSGTGASSPQGGIWGFGIFNNGDEGKIAAARQFIKYYGVLNYLLKDGLHVIDKSIN